jgi:hypothetical protein
MSFRPKPCKSFSSNAQGLIRGQGGSNLDCRTNAAVFILIARTKMAQRAGHPKCLRQCNRASHAISEHKGIHPEENAKWQCKPRSTGDRLTAHWWSDENGFGLLLPGCWKTTLDNEEIKQAEEQNSTILITWRSTDNARGPWLHLIAPAPSSWTKASVTAHTPCSIAQKWTVWSAVFVVCQPCLVGRCSRSLHVSNRALFLPCVRLGGVRVHACCHRSIVRSIRCRRKWSLRWRVGRLRNSLVHRNLALGYVAVSG